MKIILTSIGTRGDMEPFVAIGEILKENGHEIICLFPEQFRNITEDSGFEFASLGSEIINMIDSPAGRTAMGGGKFSIKKMKAYLRLNSMQKEVNKGMIIKQEAVIKKEQPDRVIHSGKLMYPVIWGIENKGNRILLSPVPYLNYVKDHSHVAFNKNFGAYINKLTYDLTNFELIKTIAGSLKWLSTSKKLKKLKEHCSKRRLFTPFHLHFLKDLNIGMITFKFWGIMKERKLLIGSQLKSSDFS